VVDDLQLLWRFGEDLDARVRRRGDEAGQDGLAVPPTVRDRLIEGLLKVRSKTRGLIPLKPNRAQQEYSRRCTKRNIVLKARQLGITTYVAARFFVQTIMRSGTMTVQVAHNQESAEEIFKIVHRFWENLPEATRESALITSRCNIRQMIFPRLDSEYRVASAADLNAGRGLTIHNLHCSEVARWPRAGLEALTSLRAAVPVHGEVVLESTPNGASGVFYEEWQKASETGYRQHFFPWWYDEQYVVDGDEIALHPLTDEERELVARVGLTKGQVAWRRTNRAQLRGLAAQEYAEDAVSCFKASGECVFDLEAIECALQGSGEPLEMSDSRRLMVWLPAQAGKAYVIGVDPAGGGPTAITRVPRWSNAGRACSALNCAGIFHHESWR
jgi:hypothetical protein